MIPEMRVLDNGQIGLEDFLRELAKPLGIRPRAGIGADFDGYGVLSGREAGSTAPIIGGAVWQIYSEIVACSTTQTADRRRRQ